jgi:proton-dependent oligopeptide transporter, POT family
VIAVPIIIALLPDRYKVPVIHWVAAHPLADPRFFFFIFALMPVQTLFTYNWLVLPQYISRAFAGGWIGEYYEIASNANPILIFILVPIITALTYKRNVYNMMIWGTFVMGSSAFILALGPTPITLIAYIILMTIGEAMWSARFLQYATEIAPADRAGQYQGVAQLPWFLTKFLVPLLYSGQIMERYCPAEGPKDTGHMWLIFGIIAVMSPILLLIARKWMMKDFKTKHED